MRVIFERDNFGNIVTNDPQFKGFTKGTAKIPYKIVQNLDEIPKGKLILDIETDYKPTQKWVEELDSLVCIGVIVPEDNYNRAYIIEVNKIPTPYITKWLVGKELALHNASFDLSVLGVMVKKVEDTLLLARDGLPHLRDNRKVSKPYGLKALAKLPLFKYLGYYKDELAEKQTTFRKGMFLSKSHCEYLVDDIMLTRDLFYLKQTQATKLKLSYIVDCEAIRNHIGWQKNGIPVNTHIVRSLIDETKLKLKQSMLDIERANYGLPINSKSPKVKALLNLHLVAKVTNREFLSIVEEFDFNWSVAKLHSAIKLRYKDIKLFDKADENALIQASSLGIEVAKHILTNRQARGDIKKLETYNHSKLRAIYHPAGAITGRYTCNGGNLYNGVNLQQVSRKFKKIFEAPKGSLFITMDYSTAELRTLCSLVGDMTMFQAFKQGIDLHKLTASRIPQPIRLDDVTKKLRQNAKAYNFGLAFGMGVKTFIQYAFSGYGVTLSEEEASKAKKMWLESYPKVAELHREVWKGMERGNYLVHTPLGRTIKPTVGTEGINAPTQGGIGETTKISLNLFLSRDSQASKMVVNTVHDSIVLMVREEEVYKWSKLLYTSMQDGWKFILQQPSMLLKDIPMPIDIEIGSNLGSTTEMTMGEIKDKYGEYNE